MISVAKTWSEYSKNKVGIDETDSKLTTVDFGDV